MASYRPYPPPPSSFAPSQNPNSLPPPPHPPPPRGQFAGGWGYGDGSSNYQMPPNSNYLHQPPFTSSSRPPQPPAQPPPYQYTPQPPPPPPPDSSYPAQPPQPPSQPPGMYYPTSSQHLYSQPETAPPPPPSEPPPSSLIPPPPPQGSPPQPLPPQSKDSSALGRKPHDHYKRAAPRERESTQLSHGVSDKQPMKPPAAVVKRSNGSSVRMETEEERRLRKKREYEKLQQEKHRQQLKEQNMALQKTQNMASLKGHGSIVGSRLGDKRAAPLLSGERTENRLKKPTTFLCKMKFRNELPDASAPMKLMSLKKDKDRFSKYTITSLEKMWKPQLYVEPDLGIPLDLLDLSVYNPPSAKPPLAPEDEELLRDDDVVTPIKKDGIRKKERPTDKGVSWLVKTQYISPLSLDSAKQSLTEKQAKELRELKGGRNILENVNSRERQIKDIEASFEACKLRPVHATNKNLYPVEVLPLFPDFDRFNDRFVLASFDNAPTLDSEIFSKMDQSVRDEHESRALMKSYVANGSDPSQPEKFLAYMVPSTDELSKDMLDEEEDINYSWIREYNWDVRGDDADDLTTYFVSFDDDDARYVPLPTKLTLRKKRAKEGRSTDEVEHFPVPASITVRQRPTAAAIELKEESGGYSNIKGKAKMTRGMDDDEGLDSPERYSRPQEMEEQSSGAEEYSD